MAGPDRLAALEAEIVGCRLCPRLVAWREEVARVKRAAFADHEYWGRPLPGFGDPDASVVVLGLAPAAHGGNRTGRIFTGDRSGDWLFAALWRAGYANQPESVSRDDGLVLSDGWVTAGGALRASGQQADPDRARHLPALLRRRARAASAGSGDRVPGWLCLGCRPSCASRPGSRGPAPPPPLRPRGRGQIGRFALLGCYHVSQQNTFTGRLTEPMLDAVFARARELAGGATA